MRVSRATSILQRCSATVSLPLGLPVHVGCTEGTKPCRHLQRYAEVYRGMQTFTEVCKFTLTEVRRSLLKYAERSQGGVIQNVSYIHKSGTHF